MSKRLSALVRHMLMAEAPIKAPQKTKRLAKQIVAFCLSAALPQSVCHPTCAVVFSDIVCTNLEYFSKFSDVTIWEFHNKVGLEHKVHSAGGLDGKVFCHLGVLGRLLSPDMVYVTVKFVAVCTRVAWFSHLSRGSNALLLPEVLVNKDTHLDLFDTESEDAYFEACLYTDFVMVLLPFPCAGSLGTLRIDSLKCAMSYVI